MYIPKGTKFFLSNKIEGIPLLEPYNKEQIYYVTWPSGALNGKKNISWINLSLMSKCVVFCYLLCYADGL